ncbi:hypothetical protein CF386_12310 [Paraphotobacterium marinum]|uniref:Chorismate lyase n=1 Tax=Paraphotobacterium marinum TaxID=1755811 RepID=A0A220VHT9_9GAMM|nr:chorismate lyase [Paraphotobacterium marinum]ASK79816.1 hypothetical protein CF386_12310 [Paraphotobacterium marinum]
MMKYLELLDNGHWTPIELNNVSLSLKTKNILIANSSLSHILKMYCNVFSVQLLNLPESNIFGIEKESMLKRSVVLKGDGVDWVVAQSFFRKDVKDLQYLQLTKSKEPIGFNIFKSQKTKRQDLRIYSFKYQEQHLLARKSTIIFHENPIYLQEIFLKECPIYNLS